MQKRVPKSSTKKEKEPNTEDSDEHPKDLDHAQPTRHDCGGAIHIKFSLKREAINVVYKHIPIHSTATAGERYVVPSRSLMLC